MKGEIQGTKQEIDHERNHKESHPDWLQPGKENSKRNGSPGKDTREHFQESVESPVPGACKVVCPAYMRIVFWKHNLIGA